MSKEKGFTLDDEEIYRGPFSPVCTLCKHYPKHPKVAEWKCDAFDKIPEEIWFGKNKHTEEVKGDKGIRFEKIDKIDKFVESVDSLLEEVKD
jgi:hypothetical protein